MNSRRFIRSSSQLEETAAEYQVSMVVALTAGTMLRCKCGVWAQDRYGSIASV